jgi:hypothetical protein
VHYRSSRLHFAGTPLSLWDSYGLADYTLGSGNLSEDARGRWHLNITVTVTFTRVRIFSRQGKALTRVEPPSFPLKCPGGRRGGCQINESMVVASPTAIDSLTNFFLSFELLLLLVAK